MSVGKVPEIPVGAIPLEQWPWQPYEWQLAGTDTLSNNSEIKFTHTHLPRGMGGTGAKEIADWCPS